MKSMKGIWKLIGAALAVAGVVVLVLSHLEELRALANRCTARFHRHEDDIEADWFEM